VIVKAIKNRDYTWLLAKIVRYVTLNIRFNHEEKKWEISSGKSTDPAWGKVFYTDIEEIFKSKPSSYTVHEERFPNGRFKSFIVETR